MIKTKWDLNLLIENPSDEDLNKDLEETTKVVREFVKKWEGRTDYLENPKILKEALDEYEELMRERATGGKASYYLFLATQLDQKDTDLKAKYNKALETEIDLINEIQFFTHRIAKIDPKNQGKFLEAKELSDYKHFLETAFEEAKYLLSEDEEKILVLTSTTSKNNWSKMVNTFLTSETASVLTESGKKETVPFETIGSLTHNENEEIRRSAQDAHIKILEKHSDVAEHEINSILEYAKTIRKLRNFDRPDLPRLIGDDFEPDIVDALIEAVSSRNDISTRFYELKAKLYGVDQLEYYDRNLNYGDLSKPYPYEDAVDLVDKAFEKTDPRFHEIFREYVETGLIDAFPSEGKRSGGYCVTYINSLPSYILMNSGEKVTDVLTLAHEMGHAVNAVLNKETQNSLNASESMATAEVASTFFEGLAFDELISGSDEETKFDLLVNAVDDSMKTIHRQIACYRFEQELHNTFSEKGYLSKDEIGEMFSKQMSAYMGPGIKQGPGSKTGWILWGHIRMMFYVYSYASGLLISMALQNEYKKDKEFLDKIKIFLSSGSSKSPKDIFMDMGVDISDSAFWHKGLDEIEEMLDKAEELAKKLGKI